ncbi:Leucine-rich repeat protein SHOC-2 [Hondaea fermentalgiana]|uniref:Leucine-rich repeat protein SHOC-2 n=1 Tax=Hondaea fermentalgiana TaxID=2315210 RepID=A0A2R5GLQ1_9STRA|nr:Leucine-rich repeat protein SHOC-2 [Hondaea fermentalgiana]|eukprot:GBG30668.1 Leucine-rich repeat protein SHOC-2 [Hondaea fermentalgiana]
MRLAGWILCLGLTAVCTRVAQASCFCDTEICSGASTELTCTEMSSLAMIPSLTDVPDLKYLYLDTNELSSLPDDFGLLAQVDTLSNQISTLPESFAHLTNLTYLSEIEQFQNPSRCLFENDGAHNPPSQFNNLTTEPCSSSKSGSSWEVIAGAVVGVMAVCGAVALLWFRHRRLRLQDPSAGDKKQPVQVAVTSASRE